jgi:hypothetical protein
MMAFQSTGGKPVYISASGHKKKIPGLYAMVVKSGSYQISSFADSRANGSITIQKKGKALAAALGDYISIDAGKVVYIGKMTAHIGGKFPKGNHFAGLSQQDNFSEAQIWVKENLPQFSADLKKQLIPCTLCTLRKK